MAKSDETTILSRIHDVTRLLLAGAEFADIRQYALERKWEVSDRHIRRYIEKAYKRLTKVGKRDRDQLLGRHLMQRRALYARCLKGGDMRTALQVVRDEANLLGLYDPALSGVGASASAAPRDPADLTNRITRMLAAGAKEDWKQLRALRDAAPMATYRMPETTRPMLALCAIGQAYVAEQLQCGLLFFYALWKLTMPGQLDDPDPVQVFFATLGAYRHHTCKRAWKLFTEKMGLSADDLVRIQPTHVMLSAVEEYLLLEPTDEEMAMARQDADLPVTALPTAEEMAEMWCKQYTRSLR